MRPVLKVTALAAVGALAVPALANAQSAAMVSTDLNMRAGPGSEHAVVGVIPANASVTVHDCTPQGAWCQVSYGGNTAWSSSTYLSADTAGVAEEPMGEERVVVAGPDPAQRQGFPVGTSAGIAGGALAGGLIGGPPGAIIGGTVGAAAGASTIDSPSVGLPSYQTR